MGTPRVRGQAPHKHRVVRPDGSAAFGGRKWTPATARMTLRTFCSGTEARPKDEHWDPTRRRSGVRPSETGHGGARGWGRGGCNGTVWDKDPLETDGRAGYLSGLSLPSPHVLLGLRGGGGPGLPTAAPTVRGTLVPCPKKQVPPALKAGRLDIRGQVRTSGPWVPVLRSQPRAGPGTGAGGSR